MHSTANFFQNHKKVAVQCNYSIISYYLCSAMHYTYSGAYPFSIPRYYFHMIFY